MRRYSEAEKIFSELLIDNPNYVNAIINLANLKKDTYFWMKRPHITKKHSQLMKTYLNYT